MTATRTLYYREGKSDKVYVAILLDGTVTFKWGRRGASLQQKTFGPMSPGAAHGMYNKKLEEKLSGGYRDQGFPGGMVGNSGVPKFNPANVQHVAPPPPPLPLAFKPAVPGMRKFRSDD